jgi:hypothetical protein
MAFELRDMTFGFANPLETAGYVSFFAGDGPKAEGSTLWIAGRVLSDAPTMKSLALNQLTALHTARTLLDEEIGRLTSLYQQAEQAQC